MPLEGDNSIGATGVGAELSGPFFFPAVRRDDSWAGSIATTLLATISPAIRNIELRVMTYPTRGKMHK
jgi:hypothetical protein